MAIQSLTGEGDASSLFHPCSFRPCTLSCLIPSSSKLVSHFYFHWSPRYRLTTVLFLSSPPPPRSLPPAGRNTRRKSPPSTGTRSLKPTSSLPPGTAASNSGTRTTPRLSPPIADTPGVSMRESTLPGIRTVSCLVAPTGACVSGIQSYLPPTPPPWAWVGRREGRCRSCERTRARS